MARIASIVLFATLSGCRHPEPTPPDPTATDGDKYQVIFENPAVRVLRYHDQPGARTRLHHHPAFALYALAPFSRQLRFPDGATRARRFEAGEVAWMQAQDHVGENIGSTPTEALLIEPKGCP
jgi:hypothetical protein